MLTLKKVKEMVKAPIHTKRVPSPKVLLEDGRILLRKEFEHDSHLTLYHSGYVWFSTGKRNTVFHIHDCCGDYAYGASKGKGEVIKEEYFENCEWHIQNYARKKEIALEMLRYPIHDDELWALTFLKQDTIFVCVNTALPLCKQFFAAAHELYHIYCYVENADQSYIKNGSMLDSATGDETGRTQEDLEANAFAGLLLMPDQLLHEQILLYGLDKDLVTVDSVLMLMDMFAMPYKAVVLRLFESGNISHQQAEKLLEVGSADVMERVSLTGKAKRWQLDGKGTESFGTLLEKVEYNRQHEYLTESREKEDVAYLTQLKKEYGLD